MRLSERLNGSKRRRSQLTAGRVVSSADRRLSANAVNGRGQFSIAAPWGVESIPESKSDAVIISGDSERICLGVKQNSNPYGIKPGELVLHAGSNTYIHLKADGKIEINGEVYINGTRWGD